MISSTIADSGGDYTTMGAWEAAISDTDDETGTCTSSTALQTTTLTLNAANTGTWDYLLTANDASKVNAPTTSALSGKARTTNNIAISGTGWVVEKIGFYTATGGFLFNVINISGAGTVVRRVGGHLSTSTCNDYVTVSVNATFDNCFFTGAGTGVVIGNSANTLNLYHCSIISQTGGYAGYYTSGGTRNAYACICQGAGTNWKSDGGTQGGDYQVSQDATATATNKWTSQSNVYVSLTGGSEDLALASASQGDYASADYTGTITDTATDIVGTTRTGTIDVGVWQTPPVASNTGNFLLFM